MRFQIGGLEQFKKHDFRLDILRHVAFCLRETVNGDFNITKLGFVGSRIDGTYTSDSDLDVIIEYEGDYREDDVFNGLNEEPLYIEGVRLDFVPFSIDKGNEFEGDYLDILE